MKAKVWKSNLAGTIGTVPSKSVSHRLLIAGALSGIEPSQMNIPINNKDMEATKACVEAMLKAKREGNTEVVLPCGESGSTFRFIIPIVAALGLHGVYHLEGRLPQRPLTGYYEALQEHGCVMSPEGSNPFTSSGQLESGTYTVRGDISSQFITGLLFALPLLEGDSRIEVVGPLESKPYVDITLSVLEQAGIQIVEDKNSYIVKGHSSYRLPVGVRTEEDWSNYSFWFSYAALTGQPVVAEHMNLRSRQGDKKILDILEAFGATVLCEGAETDATVRVHHGELKGIVIDATDIPDAIPVLAAVAAGAKGVTEVINAGRLRIKESDRLESTTQVLRALGAKIEELPEGLRIYGQSHLQGGATVDSYNDHRIAMMAAVAAGICLAPVEITTAQAVQKSYPHFFSEYKRLGGRVEIVE